MNAVSENTTLVFTEDGKNLTDIFEQIFKILINIEWESEENGR